MHWTEALKAENAILRDALKNLISETRSIVASRFDKVAKSPDGDQYDMGYIACAGEVSLRVDEAISRAKLALD